MRESALESKLVREVKNIGGLALKWTSPGQRGVPDRLILLPEGRVEFVEMKAPGKPLEPLQERWARILSEMGFGVRKIDSEAEIAEFIREVSS